MRSLAGNLSIDFSRRCGPRDHKSKKVRSTKRLHRRLSYPRRAGDDVVDLQLGYDGVRVTVYSAGCLNSVQVRGERSRSIITSAGQLNLGLAERMRIGV